MDHRKYQRIQANAGHYAGAAYKDAALGALIHHPEQLMYPGETGRCSIQMNFKILSDFLIFLLFAMPGGADALPQEHRLRFYNTHTREHLEVVYRRGGQYVSDALSRLDGFLRDDLSGATRHFNPRLFDLLSELIAASGRPDAEINVVCGYRTPSTNEYLRARTTGVAKTSLHMQAEAIDIRLPGVNTSKLRDLAILLRRGGVGYYAASDFIHVDVGRVRYW